MYENKIPDDRHSELSIRSSSDGIYSVAINAHEMHAGDFYVSVQCSPEHDAVFDVFAKFEPAHLGEGVVLESHVCPVRSI